MQTIIFGENAFKTDELFFFFFFSFRNEIISTTDLLYPPGFALLCLLALGEMVNTLQQADSLFPASPGLVNTAVLCISWGIGLGHPQGGSRPSLPLPPSPMGSALHSLPEDAGVVLACQASLFRPGLHPALWFGIISSNFAERFHPAAAACRREGEGWIHTPASLHISGIRKVSLPVLTKDILKIACSL